MEDALSATIEPGDQRTEQNQRISEVIRQERRRLFQFIRKRVDDEGDAEDILQDVFSELIEAYRLMKPIYRAGWRLDLPRGAESHHRSRACRPSKLRRMSHGEVHKYTRTLAGRSITLVPGAPPAPA